MKFVFIMYFIDMRKCAFFLQMKEKHYFGQQHLDISYALTGLGIAYRKVGRFEEAGRVYQR